MTALAARDLFYLYRSPSGDVAALRGLSLELAQGETIAALGPSGSGKSTLLALAAGFLRPSSGELVVLGEHLERTSRRDAALLRRRQIGIVRQHYHRALPHELTVEEIVALPSRLLGEHLGNERKYVAGLLARAGLSDRAGARPSELSGGEQQRVALCAALAKQPRLLLADEPTGELDAETRDEVVDLLIELTADTDAAALIVTHDPEVAARAQRTIHVRDGRLAAEGTDRPVLIVDDQGWVRLPTGLRRQAKIGERVRAQASLGKIELLAEASDVEKDPGAAHEAGDPAPAPAGTSGGEQADGAAVVLDRVIKRYGDPDPKPVIDLTWTAGAARFHVVAGPSGSGKTTLLNLIAALDRPDSGEITIASQRIDQLSPDDAADFRERNVGYLSQHSTLIDYMSARENVELALTFRGHGRVEARAEAEQWLEWVGLGKLADRPANHLSGGEQRRVALARALAPMPALLIADEPTAHLDQLAGRNVIRLLQDAVRDHGTTIIAASHDPDVLAATNDVLNLDSVGTRPRRAADALRPPRDPSWATARRPTNGGAAGSQRKLGRNRAALVAAFALAAVAAAILAATHPWHTKTGTDTTAILQHLRAAIATPTATQVLYQRVTITLGTPIAGLGANLRLTSWTAGGASPRLYRATILSRPPPSLGPRIAVDAGGILGPTTVGPFTAYVRGEQLGPFIPASPPISSDAVDAIGIVRSALAAADPPRAPIVSSDRRLVRVRLFIRDYQGGLGRITYLAERSTYHPVAITFPHIVQLSSYVGGTLGLGGIALLAPQFGAPAGGATTETFVFHYRAFAYQRATPQERKLANIQALHAHVGARRRSSPYTPTNPPPGCVRPFGIFYKGHCIKTKPGAAGT
jgi:ABC-type lipoprotein export system ATPase subunit